MYDVDYAERVQTHAHFINALAQLDSAYVALCGGEDALRRVLLSDYVGYLRTNDIPVPPELEQGLNPVEL